MAEALGQRSLLGFAVVLVWMVLFHLYVNIWLLCVFTSLLVVLGGWLSSQAALESNTLVHLERFITLEQVPPAVDDEHHLDQEIHNTVRKIIRDFVSSWYCTVSSRSGFELEVQEAMIAMAMELKTRARQVDRKELTQRILDLFGCHLQDYLIAKELVSEQTEQSSDGERLWKAYSRVSTPHPVMASDTVEVNYARAVVTLLLHILVPSPHLETCSGRFVVGELITCNVLLPLVAKLSDPDWLNLLMVEVFTKSRECRASIAGDPLTSSLSEPPLQAPCADSERTPQPDIALVLQNSRDVPPYCMSTLRSEAEVIGDTQMATPKFPGFDIMDSEECPQTNPEEGEPTGPFLRNYLRPGKSNPFYQENDSDLDSPLIDYKRGSIDSLLMITQEDGLYDIQKDGTTSIENNVIYLEDGYGGLGDGSCPKVLLNSGSVDPADGFGSSSLRALSSASLQDLDREGISPNPTRDLLLGVDQNVLGSSQELNVVSPLQGSSPMSSFSFEPLGSPEGPVIIQNLRITGTITAKEHRGTGSHPYTLYTIKYETAMGCENPGSVQSGSADVESVQSVCEISPSIQSVAYHMVNRRYSEFLNLQIRLEERPELRKLSKGVKGPKKIFPEMPFGNMDSDKIEARKGLLETFLKHLCAIPEIANSEEVQEFLALNTDARIAFVKKPFLVSRIDKIVVSAIVDTLKTAFPRSEPQSPTEDNEMEVDASKMTTDKKSKSRLRFPSKNIPFMNGGDMRPAVLFSSAQSCSVFNGLSLVEFEVKISDLETLFIRAEMDKGNSPAVGELGSCRKERMRRQQNLEPMSETALAEVALNILCLLMKEQWSWLCTENIQRTIKLLFGTLINRWLDVSVANLTCTRYWVLYLQVLQEAIWPGGALPTSPRPERSQQQKDVTKQQALQCLITLLPDLVSDMLGSDKYKLSWRTALDSLQDPNINRHLLYCICDLLLEFLVPELPNKGFQKTLLQNISKTPDRIPS